MSNKDSIRSELKKQVEDIKKVRGTWGNINPVTRVVGSKSKEANRRKKEQKHKGRDYDER